MSPSRKERPPKVKPTFVTLRVISLIAWIPGFAMLLAYGITTGRAIPTFCIIPLSFSAILAIVHLSGEARYPAKNAVVDAFLVILYLAFLIPTWVHMGNEALWTAYYRYGWQVRSALLATHGTMPAIFNLCIHLFLLLNQMHKEFGPNIAASMLSLARSQSNKTCPHCDGDLRTTHTVSHHRYAALGSTPDYNDDEDVEEGNYVAAPTHVTKEQSKPAASTATAFRDEPVETLVVEPRPSTDDETAPLV